MGADYSSAWGTGPSLTETLTWNRRRVARDGTITDYPSSAITTVGRRSRDGQSSNKLIGGWRKPSSYGRWSQRFSYGKGSMTIKYPDGAYDLFTGQSEPVNTGSDIIRLNTPFFNAGVVTQANIERQCVVKCLNKLTSGGAQVGSALAEAHKTVSEIADLATDLMELYRALRSYNIPQAARVFSHGYRLPEAIANRWLQYQYGWRPLMNDIYDLWHVLTTKQLQNDMIVRATARSSTGYSGTFIGPDAIYSPSGKYTASRVVYAKVRNSTVVQLSRMGLINPASVAWEITPFSFLIDWALPVGSLLSAWSSMAGFDFLGGSSSTKVDVSTTIEKRFTSSTQGATVSGTIPVTFTASAYSRGVLGTWPIPVPYVKNPLSNEHVANAAALITSMR